CIRARIREPSDDGSRMRCARPVFFARFARAPRCAPGCRVAGRGCAARDPWPLGASRATRAARRGAGRRPAGALRATRVLCALRARPALRDGVHGGGSRMRCAPPVVYERTALPALARRSPDGYRFGHIILLTDAERKILCEAEDGTSPH